MAIPKTAALPLGYTPLQNEVTMLQRCEFICKTHNRASNIETWIKIYFKESSLNSTYKSVTFQFHDTSGYILVQTRSLLVVTNSC